MKAWTFKELEEVGQIEKYGGIYYVREVFLLPKLLKIGRREKLIKRDKMGRFLYNGDIDVTVRNYCRDYDHKEDKCLEQHDENERYRCEELNIYCKKFDFTPYLGVNKSGAYTILK
jgi:hypothetical protein